MEASPQTDPEEERGRLRDPVTESWWGVVVDGPTDADQLGREFTDEMFEGYRYLARTINYRAKQFLEMVTMHGGVGAAKILLQGRNASDGFTRLWQARMLDRSVEASVLRPRYEQLFTDEERGTARRRLEAHGFDVEGFLAGRSD